MKKNIFFLSIVFCCFLSSSIFAQFHDANGIDPRKYVNVMYRKFPTSKLVDTILNWEYRTRIPDQKFSYLNTDGIINIVFDRQGLSENKAFEGTLTLEAEISGSGGTRKIEVNPYSEIGAQRIPIGIKSEPPTELAKRLLNMIINIRDEDLTKHYGSLLSFKNIITEYLFYTNNIRKLDALGEYKKDITNRQSYLDTVYSIAIAFNDKYTLYDEYSSGKYKYRGTIDKRIKIEMLDDYVANDDLTKARNIVKQFLTDNAPNTVKLYSDLLKELPFITEEVYNKVNITNEYLTAFNTAGEDATKAIFSIMNKDYISYRHLIENIGKQKAALESQSFMNESIENKIDILINVCRKLIQLSELKQTKLEMIAYNMLNDTAKNRLQIEKNKPYSYDYERIYNKLYTEILSEKYDLIADSISTRTSKIIYKNLIYATIDLGKSGASNGEVLNIYLVWIRDSKKDSIGNSPRLPLGKYHLQKTGWGLEVSDMFALVQRVDASFDTSSNVSPSNFKGSGGATFVWTYRKEDKGLKIKIKDDGYKVHKKNRVMNFLEPSIGINVSYLDFRTDRDIEIGTGIQLGLFRNKVFFGGGTNLHLLRPTDVAPYYFFIGFSFAKLQDLFKDSGSVSSNQ